MARKSEKQFLKDRTYKPENMYGTPIPARTFQITGPDCTGIHKIRRIGANRDGSIYFMIDDCQQKYETAKHKFVEVKGK